ncbi:MAG: hypothetical protein H0U27_08790, partial [Nitrosopumilus sp.]|nr:hypothetical protein [Nitrosopumilus sp.]
MEYRINSYKPTFIINLEPNRYGCNQDDYLSRGEELICKTANRITSARENGENLEELFFEIIKNFGASRRLIATQHKTEKASQFGVRRDNYYPGRIYTLPLQGIYKETGDKIYVFF